MPKVNYKGWPNCYRLANGQVELIATSDVGPRIIHFGFVGGENVFKVYDEQAGLTGGDQHRLYGGHRLWHAPEVAPRTYEPDNGPVAVQELSELSIRLIQPTEKTTGIQKEIDIHLDPKQAHVRVVHRLRNMNLWPIELACWAVSVLAQGGKAIIPLPPRGPHTTNLLPVNILTMWAYTNMSDPRWTWGNKYIMLRQDPNVDIPQKLGVMNAAGWAAYACNGNLFVKTFSYVPGAAYPDWGCSVETFTWASMLELETLGPLVKLDPKVTIEHVEDWHLFKDVAVPSNDADVDATILPKVKTILEV